MGAIASGGAVLLNEQVVHSLGVSQAQVQRVLETENRELARREERYRGNRPAPQLAGNTVILVDDGLATGSTMMVAVAALRAERPARIVVAVPVGSPDSCAAMRAVADEVICSMTPEPFQAVGLWYDDFSQTSDEEVHELLDRSAHVRH